MTCGFGNCDPNCACQGPPSQVCVQPPSAKMILPGPIVQCNTTPCEVMCSSPGGCNSFGDYCGGGRDYYGCGNRGGFGYWGNECGPCYGRYGWRNGCGPYGIYGWGSGCGPYYGTYGWRNGCGSGYRRYGNGCGFLCW